MIEPLETCPSCGCHVACGGSSCPHCDASLERTRGRLPPAVVALMMGLGAVAATAACDQRQVDDDGNGGEGGSGWPADDDGSYADGGKAPSNGPSTAASNYPSVVSTYGTGPSFDSSSSTGITECPELDDGTPCGMCLADSCCAEGMECLESQPCLDVSECLSTCGPDDLVCATECQQAFPEGFALYQTLWQCGSANCELCFE